MAPGLKLDQWKPADRSDAAEKRSLQFQASRIQPMDLCSQRVCEVMEQLGHEQLRVMNNDEDVHDPAADIDTLRQSALLAVRNLKPDASPGNPYSQYGATNEMVLETKGEAWLVEHVVIRCLKLMTVTTEYLESLSAREMVEQGFSDPRRVFVKNELHSAKKVAEGRYRLIFAISVVDQCVERVFNSTLNHLEVENWAFIDSKPGMGLHDEGLTRLQENIRSLRQPGATDAIGWDFCADYRLFYCDAHLRAKAHGFGGRQHPWLKLAVITFLSVIVLSSGEMWEQVIRAIQKSGSLNTSSGNSKARRLLGMCVAPMGVYTRVIAMGDDSIEETHWAQGNREIIEDAYRKAKVPIKGIQLYTDENKLEFCAYDFDLEGGFTPVRVGKMVANFISCLPPPDQEYDRLIGLQYEIRHAPESVRKDALRVTMQVLCDRNARVAAIGQVGGGHL